MAEAAMPPRKIANDQLSELIKGSKPLDPYWVLANMTNFGFLQQGRKVRTVPFLVETRMGTAALIGEIEALRSKNGIGYIWIPSAYKRSLKVGGKPSKYLTCLVPDTSVVAFLGLENVIRSQMGIARKGEEFVASNEGFEKASESKLKDLLDLAAFFKKWSSNDGETPLEESLYLKIRSKYAADEYGNRTPLDASVSDRPVIGVVDDDIPFAHPNLRGPAGQFRTVRVWNQNVDETGKEKNLPLYFGYGRVTSMADMVRQKPPVVLPSEFKRIRRQSLASSHGASTCHVVAGNTPVDPQGGVLGLPQDLASGCDLIGVEFPRDFLKDTASGSLCVQALDAVRYIIDRAETYAPQKNADGTIEYRVPRKVVINFGYGGMGGPRNGTGLLDCAFDELMTQRGRLRIVAAAGNSHRIPCHAHLSAKKNAPAVFSLFVAPENPLLTTVEIWLSDGNASLARVSVCLTAPDGSRGPRVPIGSTNSIKENGVGLLLGSVVFPKVNAQSGRSDMVLVAIFPTDRYRQDAELAGQGIGRAPSGAWTITVENPDESPLEFDAWVERSDMADRSFRRQQAYFVGDGVTDVVQRVSFASPASATRVTSVGAKQVVDGEVSGYSGRGTWRNCAVQPDAFAFADAGPIVQGLRVPGRRTNSTTRFGGTSVAAPQVARAIVNDHGTQVP